MFSGWAYSLQTVMFVTICSAWKHFSEFGRLQKSISKNLVCETPVLKVIHEKGFWCHLSLLNIAFCTTLLELAVHIYNIKDYEKLWIK